MRPVTKYAKSGELRIAYQVVGRGSIDLVWAPGYISHVEYGWEYPPYANFINRLAAFSRVIRFDKRGTGLSDRAVAVPTLEDRMDDVLLWTPWDASAPLSSAKTTGARCACSLPPRIRRAH